MPLINTHSYPEPVVFQWQSSGNPVCLELRPQCTLECHWRNASVLPVVFQWSSSVFQLCKLILDRHWDTTGCYHQPVWFQWHPSVLVAPVVFQCVPIMQINTGSPLEHHWALASASVVPVAFQCTCGSSGIPVWSSSGIPVYLQNLVWRSLGQVTSQHAIPNVYNWYGESCLS